MSNRIYQIRKKKELSQEEMASDLGVSANYISLIENGKKEPGLSLLKKVAKKYDFPFILLAQDKILPVATNSREREIRNKLTSLMTEIENNMTF
ncbi:MAG TPA: helix-turn-helix transcriptional regulator [Candidatus Paceibacterota bacterium]|jgi:transcriptional regulator with XRE-family HTH domain|nr:helix-turn-helix transcriptional regulator [Candidatus Paceibacterota bacterium]